MAGTRYERFRLVGDEDCGVGIECRDHFDGGRPLAYYGDASAYEDDPEVENVTTISGLLAAAERHERRSHRGWTVGLNMTFNADPTTIVHHFSPPTDPSIQIAAAAQLRQMKRQYGSRFRFR